MSDSVMLLFPTISDGVNIYNIVQDLREMGSYCMTLEPLQIESLKCMEEGITSYLFIYLFGYWNW